MGFRKRKTKSGVIGFSRDEWVRAARDTLVKQGFVALKVDKIAKDLGVSRGGFYWRFESFADLLDALVEDWRKSNTTPLLQIMRSAGTPQERFRLMQLSFIEEKIYSPDYDAAMREWARVSPKVAKVVHAVDDERVEALKDLFLDAGYDQEEAFIRARITYFHQLGYYRMGVHETQRRRKDLSATYFKVLTGFDMPAVKADLGKKRQVSSSGAPTRKTAKRATR